MRLRPLFIVLLLIFSLSTLASAMNPRVLFVERIRFPDGDTVHAGDSMRIILEVENEGDSRLYGTSVFAAIPELGIYKRQGRVDMARGDVNKREVILDIPKDVKPGAYLLRVFVSDDNSFVNRKLFRWITME